MIRSHGYEKVVVMWHGVAKNLCWLIVYRGWLQRSLLSIVNMGSMSVCSSYVFHRSPNSVDNARSTATVLQFDSSGKR